MLKSGLRFLLFFCCFVFTSLPITSSAAVYDGEWSGFTDQGYEVRFTVSNDRVTSFNIKYGGSGYYCSSWSSTRTVTGSTLISNGQFTISGEEYNSNTYQYDEYSFTGSFLSSSECMGTWSGENSNCVDSVSGTWSANNGGAAPVQGDDYSSDTGTEGRLSVGGSVTGNIESNGDEDWFRIDLIGNSTYTIDLEGSTAGGGTLYDPVLEGIYDGNGSLISGTGNDDYGATLNSRVEFTPPSTGRYYISAGGYYYETGSYTLSIDGGTTLMPAKAVLSSPSGTIQDATPTFTWNEDPASSWYQLLIYDNSNTTVFQEWYQASNVCAAGNCSVTPDSALSNGAHKWWVRTWNENAIGPWSDTGRFTVAVGLSGPPSAATLVAPDSSVSNPVTFSWEAVSESTWYYLWVSNSAGAAVHKKWYTAQNAGCGSGTGTCAVALDSQTLGAGNYKWWIQTYNDLGYGDWTSAMNFAVTQGQTGTAPAAATLIGPNSSVSDSDITYTWNAVSGATWYYLWVDDETGNKVKEWYRAAQAGCADGTGTCSITPSVASAMSGSCKWWIQTYNDYGYGNWSSAANFNITTSSGGDSSFAEEMNSLLSAYSSGFDMLEPLTAEISIILSAVMIGDTSSLPLSVRADGYPFSIGELMAIEEVEDLPSEITIELNYGSGHTAQDGATMTGKLTIMISGITVTAQGISLTVSIVGEDLARNGELILDGSATASAVIGLASDMSSMSLDMSININNMVSPAGTLNGQMSVSAPYISMDLENPTFDPIEISFTNFQTPEITISSGILALTISGTDTVIIDSDLNTSEGQVKGILEAVMTELSALDDNGDPQEQITLNSQGYLILGEHTIKVNDVIFNSYICEDYAIDGNVEVQGEGVIYFDDSCTNPLE